MLKLFFGILIFDNHANLLTISVIQKYFKTETQD